MKVWYSLFGLLLLALAVQSQICEECDEESPLEAPDDIIFKTFPWLKTVQHTQDEQKFEEHLDLQPNNVIDAPVVCPPGQKPDHKGKCREVWSRAVPNNQ